MPNEISQVQLQKNEKLAKVARNITVMNAPLISAGVIMTRALINGKSFNESAAEVGDTFSCVHQDNKKALHKAAETTRKAGDWRLLFTPVALIEGLDKLIND